jgi:hypothetical protein
MRNKIPFFRDRGEGAGAAAEACCFLGVLTMSGTFQLQETMLSEFKQLKAEFPDRVLIASIMEEYNRGAWEELIGTCAALVSLGKGMTSI